MWKTMPLLINTWLQRGKLPFPILACVIILLYLFRSLHFSIPSSFFSFSSLNPFLYFCYALAFSVPLLPSLSLALLLIPHPLSMHALESFCIFQGPRELWLALRQGENKGTQCISALSVVLPFSRQINTPATNCLSQFLSFAIVTIFFFHLPVWLDWSAMSGRVEGGANDEWDSRETCHLVLFSSVTVFVSAGSGWGHCPYHDCPTVQRSHWRSQSWYALCSTGPCPDSGWLRPLQQPSRLQHQPAKYVTPILTSLRRDILRYLWLSSNTSIIVLCISLWT